MIHNGIQLNRLGAKQLGPCVIQKVGNSAGKAACFIVEIWSNRLTGYLVERGDTTAFAQKLERLAADRKKCAAMGENGRRWVESRFPCDKMMEELIGIYGQLTAGTDGALAKGEKR